MIRLAVLSDVPRLVEMGLRFRRESEYRSHLSENPQQLAVLFSQLIQSDGLLVSEQKGALAGMIGYLVYPQFFSGQTVAGELFWWMEPEHRGAGIRLMREAERRAKERGAERMQMIAPNDKVASLYQRMGYEFVEATYQRNL